MNKYDEEKKTLKKQYNSNLSVSLLFLLVVLTMYDEQFYLQSWLSR